MKNFTITGIAVISLFLLSGCGGGTQPYVNKSFSANLDSSPEVQIAGEAELSENTGSVLGENQIVTITDNCEFYIEYSRVTTIVEPPNPGQFYSYYESDDDESFVDVCIAYKNLKNKAVGADKVVSATLTYDNRYEYSGYAIIEEDDRGDFTYASITSISPLTTEYIHYLFRVPLEVQRNNKSIDVELTIGGEKFSFKVR